MKLKRREPMSKKIHVFKLADTPIKIAMRADFRFSANRAELINKTSASAGTRWIMIEKDLTLGEALRKAKAFALNRQCSVIVFGPQSPENSGAWEARSTHVQGNGDQLKRSPKYYEITPFY